MTRFDLARTRPAAPGPDHAIPPPTEGRCTP